MSSSDFADGPEFQGMPVGYVVKRYPRFSETFIVTEILAHEAAGVPIEIFSLYPCTDTHFQDAIARVRAPVHYFFADNIKGAEFWDRAQKTTKLLPDLWPKLEYARGEESKVVYQALGLAAAVKQRGITHLHAHFASAATAVARLAARFAGISYTFTAHAKDIFHEEVVEEDLRKKIADAAAVITVSDFNVRDLRHRFGDDAAGVKRIYNGLDVSKLAYSDPADRPPIVLGLGRLVEKKGFADLIDACAILAHQGVEFRCRIIGEGEESASLRARVEQRGVKHLIEMSGPRPQQEVFRLIQQAAVMTVPCVVGKDKNRDGLPTVLLESMALGTPCVSTDVTGIPEVVEHENTGLITPAQDPHSLAMSIKRLLDDAPLRSRLARNARLLIEDQFDINRNSHRQRELFRTCHRAQQSEIAAEVAR
jgi:glycosyltransferase involved in cell wall biosynthesis